MKRNPVILVRPLMRPIEDNILSLSLSLLHVLSSPLRSTVFLFSFRWEGEEKVKSEQKWKPDRISVKQRKHNRPNSFAVGSPTNTHSCLSLHIEPLCQVLAKSSRILMEDYSSPTQSKLLFTLIYTKCMQHISLLRGPPAVLCKSPSNQKPILATATQQR